MFRRWQRNWSRWIREPVALDGSPQPVQARYTAVVDFVHRHPAVVDAGLALIVAIGTLPQLNYWADHASGGFSVRLVLTVLLIMPIMWRRHYPLSTFAFAASVAFVQWCLDVTVAADIVLLVYLYTVASRYRPRVGLLAAAVVELGLALAAIRWSFAAALGLPLYVTLLLLSAPVLTALLLGMTVRLRRQSLATLQARAADLERERDQRAAMAVAAESARIAREMHDVVAHSLSVMVTLSDAAILKLAHEPDRALATMRQVSDTGRQSLAEMRRVLGVLRAPGGPGDRAPQPGLGDLPALLDQTQAVGLVGTLTVSGDAEAVPPGLQLTIYRVVQEAMTNTLKHAGGATRLAVDVAVLPESVRVTVADDGRAGALSPQFDGHGLTGMRERAALYGGTVACGAEPSGGWRVQADLPLAPLTLTVPESSLATENQRP